jgi:glycerol-3-phosphate dehydrogenase
MQDEAIYQFPMLRKQGLKGAIVYYDGQHNDTRMNILIALTAAQSGAATANYVEAKELLKEKSQNADGETTEKIVGVRARDVRTGEEWDIRSKVVVNATGPFADKIRKMDDPSTPEAIVPAAGVHTIIPDHFSPDR